MKRLTKHGNSLALVIDKPVLELLKIGQDTDLDITTDGKSLLISPARPSSRRKKFEQASAWTEGKYGRAFKRLAQ